MYAPHGVSEGELWFVYSGYPLSLHNAMKKVCETYARQAQDRSWPHIASHRPTHPAPVLRPPNWPHRNRLLNWRNPSLLLPLSQSSGRLNDSKNCPRGPLALPKEKEDYCLNGNVCCQRAEDFSGHAGISLIPAFPLPYFAPSHNKVDFNSDQSCEIVVLA